jgi:uncharacterized membrane protein YfhO
MEDKKQNTNPIENTNETSVNSTPSENSIEKYKDTTDNSALKTEEKESAETTPKEVELTTENEPDFFDRLGKKAIWLALGLAVSIATYVYWDFLIFEKVLLFKDIGSDSINETWPFFSYLAENIREHGIVFWSHQFGMGDTMYLFYGDIFNWIVILFGKENVPFTLVYAQVIAILLTSIFGFKYLQILGLSNFVCIVGALTLSFSGYAILGSSGWFMTPQILYFTLSIYSIEKFIKKEKILLVVLSSFILASYNAILCIQIFLFLSFYLFIRQYNSEKIKKILFQQVLFTLLFLIGFFTASIFVFNYFELVFSSGRAALNSQATSLSENNPFAFLPKDELISVISRFFSNDLLGSGSNYKGWLNYLESPLVYIGLATTVILPFYSLIVKKDNHQKMNLFLILLVILSLTFPYIRYAFWGFQLNYYRIFSFFIAFILFFISINNLEIIFKEKKFNKRFLLFVSIIISVILFTDLILPQVLIEKTIRNKVFLFILFYMAIFYFIEYKKNILEIKLLFISALCIELGSLSYSTLNIRNCATKDELNSKSLYNDATNDVINYLNKIDKDKFRIVKLYSSGGAIHKSLNDALIQNYMGIGCYSQFQKKGYLGFLELNGLFDHNNNDDLKWSSKILGNPKVCSLAGAKYFLDKTPLNNFDSTIFEMVTKISDIHVLKNKLALPLFYFQEKLIKENELRKIDPYKRINYLYFAASVKENNNFGFDKFIIINDSITQNKNNLLKRANELKTHKISLKKLIPNSVELNIKTSKKEILCTSIPNHKGWSIYINGKKAEKIIVNGGLIGLIINEKGNHIIEFKFLPPKLHLSIIFSTLSLLLLLIIIKLNSKFKLLEKYYNI